MRDLLPAGLSFVSASTGSGTYDRATGIWAVGSLDSSGLGALGLLRIVAATTTEGLITNVASLSATDQPDSNPSNDEGSATVEVRRVADLAMAKAVATATPVAGGPLAYALTATNSGPNDASEVRIVDACTSRNDIRRRDAVGGRVDRKRLLVGGVGTVTCTWNGLTPAAGVQSVQFVVLPPASLPAATMTPNTATTASQTFDPALGNNVATVAAVLSVAADVRVVKTGPTSVVLGQNVVYAIEVTNAGPSDAAGVSLADVTPPGREVSFDQWRLHGFVPVRARHADAWGGVDDHRHVQRAADVCRRRSGREHGHGDVADTRSSAWQQLIDGDDVADWRRRHRHHQDRR